MSVVQLRTKETREQLAAEVQAEALGLTIDERIAALQRKVAQLEAQVRDLKQYLPENRTPRLKAA